MNVLRAHRAWSVRFADMCDLDALRAAVAEAKPGCILMETISNPLLRVAQIDRIAEIAREAGAALVVDNTFATPLIVRPLELGAHFACTASPSTWPAMATCWAAWWSPMPQHLEALRTLVARHRSGARARSKATSPCAASRPSRCAWSGSAPMPAGWPRG